MKPPLLSAIVFFSLFFSAKAQQQDPAAIKQSELLEQIADDTWKAGKLSESEQLYDSAFRIYPGNGLSKLASKKINIGDIKGANKDWRKLEIGVIKQFNNLMDSSFFNQRLREVYFDQANENLSVGDPQSGVDAAVKFFDKSVGEKMTMESYKLLLTAINTAFYLEDAKSLYRIHRAVTTMHSGFFNYMAYSEFGSDVLSKLADNKLAEAELRLVKANEKGGFLGDKNFADLYKVNLYYKSENFEELEKHLQKLKRTSANDPFSGPAFKKRYSLFYGAIALSRKNFKEAIDQFDIYLKRTKSVIGTKSIPEKFAIYTKRGEAYEGLNDLAHAKKDYETALLFNPNYLPAINHLAQLESKVLSELKSDKTGPEISILEPLGERGVITKASEAEIFVRGVASDAGGIKSISINGKTAYLQESGAFWANVSLTSGSNKIIIAASDNGGNSTQRVLEIEQVNGVIESTAIKEGKNYALLIACQNYDDNQIPSLQDPIPDAVKLKLILQNDYNFSEENILTLYNPEVSNFRQMFREITENILPEDNIVIFYAGHGIWVEKEKKGYWLLTDAKYENVNTWLSNKDVIQLISRLSARHILLITDACFSGSVFKTRGLNSEMPVALERLNEKISRVAITSGNDTEVPDKSVFMKYLVKALAENKEKYLTAQKMFVNQILEAVMTETKTEPRYGTLELAGHMGGDFIFTKK